MRRSAGHCLSHLSALATMPTRRMRSMRNQETGGSRPSRRPSVDDTESCVVNQLIVAAKLEIELERVIRKVLPEHFWVQSQFAYGRDH